MAGRSRQGAPDRNTQKMPLRTRRSSTRGLPRDFVGSITLRRSLVAKLADQHDTAVRHGLLVFKANIATSRTFGDLCGYVRL